MLFIKKYIKYQNLLMPNYLEYDNVLTQYGTNFTQLAKLGEFNECFGRDKELIELMEILVRKQKNNPVLIGDAGVGKTSVIELFATRIIENLVPFSLEGRLIIALNMNRIHAGAKYKGEFEQRFQSFIDEILNTPRIILFIDEIHTIVSGSSSTDGSLNVAEILKPILARGGLQCIGATTTKEYEIIEKDPALNRRFQSVQINEPTIEHTIKILYALRPSLEAFHNIEISSQAIKLAVELSSRYIYDKFLPDKAIDIIDRVAAKEVIKSTNKNNTSLITAVINSSINHIGKLKVEAFRRNNVAVVYILQEVENAYRNTLISWLENPLSVNFKDYNNKTLSSISEELVSKIRYSILANIDNLLFNSNKKNNIKEIISNNKNISFSDNKVIFNKIINSYLNKEKTLLNLYRISIIMYNLKFNPMLKKSFIIDKNLNNKIYCYIHKLLNNNINNKLKYLSKNDFSIEDSKLVLNSVGALEITKNQIVNNFLKDLKPIINKGIIISLNKTSNLNLSSNDLDIIYSLLGHLSKYNAKNLFEISDFDSKSKFKTKTKITEQNIYSLITQLTGVPLNFLSSSSTSNLLNLESTLHKRVIGQEEAISAISKAVRRSRLGIQNPKKPIASFLFCGPTGVGKTEVTKALTACMFGSEKDMIRFDMSEFMEKHSISRLIGSPPGYVGYEDGGQLTNAVRRRSYSVILFDEIEKAHPDILNILLQILDDGRLTDNQKRLVKFENTLIILTSNMGSSEIQKLLKPEDSEDFFRIKNDFNNSYNDKYFGTINFLNAKINKNFIKDIKIKLNKEFEIFEKKKLNSLYVNNSRINLLNEKNIKDTQLKEIVLEKLNSFFLPEFLNRLDDIIIFQPLKPEELRRICDIMINEIILRLKEKNITLIVSENVKLKLTKEGYNPAFGARPLKRVITKKIEDLITDTILKTSNLVDSKIISIKLNKNNQIIVA